MQYVKNLNISKKRDFTSFSESFSPEMICERTGINYENIFSIVDEIKKGVIKNGDDEIKKLTQKFDNVALEKFQVTPDEIGNAQKMIPRELKKSLKEAYKNIYTFHKKQSRKNLKPVTTTAGVTCWQEFRPIEKVGLYIPGGSAPLFSTVLMLGIPAKIAGCKKVVLCSPPNKNGEIAPEILYTANLVGITEIYKVGGAQAIFALGYGTKQIPKVDKIFGPGNAFVTAAKMMMAQKVAIDMPAGPSEVLVIADSYANPKFVAADLLSQAEHGPDSQVVLVSDSREIIQETLSEIKNQVSSLPRKEIIKKSLENSFALLTKDISESITFSNLYAPEHLILQVKDSGNLLSWIINAGSVFCGAYTPESAGDYASGTNHTLPTSGFAKSYSSIGVDSFGKQITFQEITKTGLNNLGKTIETMAQKEGLMAHKNAVKIRLNN